MSTRAAPIGKTSRVRIDLGEHGLATRAIAHLQTGAGSDVTGVGRGTHTHPGEPLVPEIGDELAAARALSDLPHRLLDAAAGDLSRVLHVDSPMALAALEVYRGALHDPPESAEFRPELLAELDPFDPGKLQLAGSRAGSERLNDPRHPCIFISASGMATGGRVLHHLEHQLPHSRDSVILTRVPGARHAWASAGGRRPESQDPRPLRPCPSRGRQHPGVLGARRLRDAPRMVAGIPDSSSAFVVHGEPASADALARELRTSLDWNAIVPRYRERVRID